MLTHNQSQSGREKLIFSYSYNWSISTLYRLDLVVTQTTTYQARYTTTYDLLHGGEGWQTR